MREQTAQFKKSTIVRSQTHDTGEGRASPRSRWWRLLSRIAPSLAGARAAAAWAKPTRRAQEPATAGAHRWTIDVNGTRLQAWDWGGDGPNVLLVHGRNGSAAQWDAFVEPLVASGFHVTAFDHPAHGASAGERATLLDLRDAVRAVADKLWPLHAIIAHSLGATATTLALDGGLQVDRVVLMAPPAELTYFARGWATTLGLDGRATDAMFVHIRRMLGVDFDALDLRRVARHLHTPALLFHSRDDREVPFAMGRAVAEAWPGAGLLPLQGVGHNRMLTTASVIAESIAFIGHRGPFRARSGEPRAA
jgi:pimeloyl-ACP methyl ester carboxylesterase